MASGGTGSTSATDARTAFDVPSKTGSGASGTWGISITGSAAGNGVPAGAICSFPATSAPPGWIKANGALLSRTAYAELYAYAVASGNIVAEGSWQAGMFSTGDLSTTFRIPDGRGEFIRGWDDARGVDAARVLGSAQSDSLKAHTHAYGAAYGYGATETGYLTIQSGASYQTGSTGAGETRPRNVALLYCMKY